MAAANEIAPESYKILPTYIESSPIKLGQRAVSGHDRAEIAKHIIPKVTYNFKPNQFWDILDFDKKSRKDFNNYTSLIVHKNKYQEQCPIIFVKSEYNYFSHPTRTQCKPDFVALRLPKGNKMSSRMIRDLYEKHPHWSFLETVGEIKSTGENENKAQNHGVSYTNFLLQARPDRTQVLGIYVKEKGFRLAVSNACGVANLQELRWEESSLPLLSRD
ncbi:hypothetical protein CPB86DRAFT_873658 [Serendipita vermifera]|nr:hypothetical protein CPB86DRAFT_873658 [Serendipita vermifera]